MPKTTFSAVILFLLALPHFAGAQTEIFNIDPAYDVLSRTEIEAELVRTTSNLYFYIEKSWWDTRPLEEQNDVRIALFELGEEFKNKIYPVLTTKFGSEPRPGIDQDERIVVLIHQMRQDAGGYFITGDVYSRFQYPKSNEREMIYLNSKYLMSSKEKSFLAHEFVHLITINQKDLLRRVTEEIWLNEARAEYAPTLLGYDDVYKGSNLENRVMAFLEKPTISLTEWLNEKENYGAANLFSQYLVDHYGIEVLVDSLRSSKIGIASLEEAIQKNGFQKNFSQVFADWVITLLVNDCKVGTKYCYLNKNLKDLRIVPTFYYLPRTETILSTFHTASAFSPNWHRFVGGGSNLLLQFDGEDSVRFEAPYLLCDLTNKCVVGFLVLDEKAQGKLSFPDFSEKYSSLTIMPFVKSKVSGFNGQETTFSFSWKVSVAENTQTEEELKSQLLVRIAELQEQLRALQVQLSLLLAGKTPQAGGISCTQIDNDLFYGMMNNLQVSCLQEFLKNQGTYPEGLVTGNFLTLTKSAVIRFQEKYASEILSPLGLKEGTGYVGSATRAKINQLIGN